MLQQYKDINGHCVCFADASTGLVEHKCKGICTRTKIPYGGEYSIEKGNTITVADTLIRHQTDQTICRHSALLAVFARCG